MSVLLSHKRSLKIKIKVYVIRLYNGQEGNFMRLGRQLFRRECLMADIGHAGEPGTLQHMATGECNVMNTALVRAVALWKTFLVDNPELFPVIKHYSLGDSFLSFLLDPTTKPLVIYLTQRHGPIISEKLCYKTRTWLVFMHKERLKLLGFWLK